ncbi:response regulator [Eubacterium sp. 1001713B170207_170306_E7]|uniref:response regulator transcription factor n=1 Tax=Eubacterium sp. 1001713B170207_170306_E7 TaxID=2787097 RepID=UPI00189753DC|nr:response regulator [Eubacterium sp. 1001713B170207_170306_E7]
MYNILVVNDREVFRRKLKRMPYWEECSAKFRISDEASNGLEALELLREQDIDLVLTDIRMPLVDGITLLKQIKQENLCNCVILLSEYAEFSYAREGILNGAFDYIVKPIDNAKVEDCFERAYVFLSSTNETARVSVHHTEALADYMLSGNLDDAMVYARHVDAELEVETEGPESSVIRMNELLKKLKAIIRAKKPYLEKYLMMDDLFQIDLRKSACKTEVITFSGCIARIFEQLKPFMLQSDNKMVQEMCILVLEKPEERHSLAGLANTYFVNQKYLGSLFKQEMDLSFSQYLTFLKMRRAEILLADKSLKIYEIAEGLGYEDVEYFSRIFKNTAGRSPSSYRESLTKKEKNTVKK